MGEIIEDNKFVIISGPKIIHFDLFKELDNNLKYETDFIRKHNEFCAEDAINNELVDYCPNISMETIFMKT